LYHRTDVLMEQHRFLWYNTHIDAASYV